MYGHSKGDSNATSRQTRSGKLIGDRYRIRQTLGSGAMGTVYWATDCQQPRAVAIKIGASTSEVLHTRFRREGALQRRIMHPAVLSVLDQGEDEGRPYLVFPYIDGKTIEAVAECLPGEKLSWKHAAWVMIALCRGLEASHAAGVIHRDVKPSNAMCDTNGNVQLIDFGLSFALGNGADPSRSATDLVARGDDGEGRLTDAGRALGTPAFISPEQAMGWNRADVTPQSDIYSMGCSLFTLITGKLPFEYSTDDRMLRAHVEEEIPDPRRYAPEIPKGIALVVRKAAARQPEYRYRSARALMQDLKGYGSPEPLPLPLVGGLSPEQRGGSTAQEAAVA